MAIQQVDRRFVVATGGRGRGHRVPLIAVAETRDEARTLKADMIAAHRANLPWPAYQPAKGTLAASLAEAWGRADGWHSKRCGPAHYSTALDFIAAAGADSPSPLDATASGITGKLIADYLAKRPDAVTAVFQLLEVMAEGGAVGWRPVRRKDQSAHCPIALLTANVTIRVKIIPVANPSRSGPLGEMPGSSGRRGGRPGYLPCP